MGWRLALYTRAMARPTRYRDGWPTSLEVGLDGVSGSRPPRLKLRCTRPNPRGAGLSDRLLTKRSQGLRKHH